MVRTSTVQKLKQTETEIAVLQVQYQNLTEKVDDLKSDLKDLSSHLDAHMDDAKGLIRKFQNENNKQHEEVNKKIAALEKWRWMLMGAGVLAGALGFDTIQKLFGM